MAALIKLNELTTHAPVRINYGVTGLDLKHAQAIMKAKVRDGWPEQKRPAQSVYVIRLIGDVAVSYPKRWSPVIYVGEGNAYGRLHGHITNWIAPLLTSIPQLAVEIRIAEVVRRNHPTLYQNIEADLLREFSNAHGAVPWFNRQHEPKKEGLYEYEQDARKSLAWLLGVGSGVTYLWAIHPTHNNDQDEPYSKGLAEK